jgi:hypothetical protein
VGVGHEHIAAPHGGDSLVVNGASMNGHILTNQIVVTDENPSLFTFVGNVLRGVTDCGEGTDLISLSYAGPTVNDNVGSDSRFVSNDHMGPNDRKGADGDILRQLCLRRYQSGGMYRHRLLDCLFHAQTPFAQKRIHRPDIGSKLKTLSSSLPFQAVK